MIYNILELNHFMGNIMTKKLTSRVLASRPMIQINGKVYYLSSGTSMVHTAGQVVGLFTNTWMGVSGVGRLELTDQGKFRRINKTGCRSKAR